MYKAHVTILAFLFCFLLSGCKTVRYVPVEKAVYRDNYKVDTIHRHDSVLVRDSVFVKQNGDSVVIDRWHQKTIYKDIYHSRIDSVYYRDSIPVPYPVEKELSNWQKIQLKYSTWVFGALLVIVIIYGVRIYRKFKIWI